MTGKDRSAGRWWGSVGFALLSVPIALAVLGVLGTCLPGIPYLGFGQLLTAFFGPWIVVLSTVAAVLLLWRWRRARRKRHIVMAGCAVLAAVGTAVVVAAQVSAIRASGSGVDLAGSFRIGPASHTSPPPIVETYGAFGRERLPLAIFRPGVSAHRQAPVLVYVHGGGWISGNYRQRDADMRWFADRGILAVSVEYALSGPDRHLWDVTHGQVGCALAWINANIERYGGDPARIALIGESAGGNLVVNVAYMANRGTLRPDCPGALPHVAAVVSLYPVIDVADFYENDGVGIPVTARAMASDYTGGSPARYPARYAAVSSYGHIRAAAPSTTVIVGARDTLVPPRPAALFVHKARAAGVDARLIVIPYAGHAFDVLPGSINNQLTRNTTMRVLSDLAARP